MDARTGPDDAALDDAATLLLRCRRERTTLDATATLADLGVGAAYEIQRRVIERRIAAGERPIGWKLGYTSLAMRRQMGIDEPNFGPLTDAMLIDDAGAVRATLIQPRVEPEIALRFHRDLSAAPGPVSRDDVLDAVGSVHACLEVVDSVWVDYRFSLPQNTADGSSAAGVVLGGRIVAPDLAAIEVELEADGVTAGRGIGGDASGHPADGIVWLLERLAPAGLRAGDLVITGGLTSAVTLRPGSRVSARFSGGGLAEPVTVSVRRGADG